MLIRTRCPAEPGGFNVAVLTTFPIYDIISISIKFSKLPFSPNFPFLADIYFTSFWLFSDKYPNNRILLGKSKKTGTRAH